MKPLVIDLYCGLGGWTEGFLTEGWDCIGFDIERHRYPARAIDPTTVKSGGGIDFNRGDSFNGTNEKRLRDAPLIGGWDEYPGQFVLQDVLTLHGSQFRNADCIVASPPCQRYSYMAMPWNRSKRESRWQCWQRDSPFGEFRLNDLFNACFRIQREASEAAGRHIPLVVENVKGAQPWVGRAKWHFGSYYLWGDVLALMPHSDLSEGVKQHGSGPVWFDNGIASHSSHSDSRKAASAMIAKIPFELSSWIARCFKP